MEDEAQASALHQLSEIGVFDFWTEVSKIIGMFQSYRMLYFQAVPGRSVDIRTSPEQSEELGVWLEQQGITWSIMIEDVGVLVEAEKVRSLFSRNYSLISPSGSIPQERPQIRQQRPLNGLDQLPRAGGHL